MGHDEDKETAMNPAKNEMTIDDVLADPMIRAVMRADGVTSSEIRTLLYSAASALRHTEPGNARRHAANLLAAPKRRLLSMVHPLASRQTGKCAAAAL